MRFGTCVGSVTLASLLTSCGGAAPGHFRPSGRVLSASSANTPDPDLPGHASPGARADGTSADATTMTPAGALATYRDYQRVYEQVYETGDAAPLRRVATDPHLSVVTRDLSQVRARGVVWRFHNVLNPKVQGRAADGSTIVILDCVRTLGAYRFSARTGERLGAWRGGSYLYQAIMKFDNGSWKISDARQGGKC